ncbi:MAG: hypothetical protein GYA62_08840 [Bacteroidales bacterium]|nr:hypothetical protein [Bacteroidales bacterium]
MKNIDHLIDKFDQTKKSSESIIKNLRSINELKNDLEFNYFGIKYYVENIISILKKGYINDTLKEETDLLIKKFNDSHANVENLKFSFINKLEKNINEIGFTMSGHLPDFKASIFTIEINFNSLNSIIWLGPKQEKISSGILTIQSIIESMENFYKKLPQKINDKDFIKMINDNYIIIKDNENEGRTPLNLILNKINDNYIKTKIKFSRAEFSYLIFKYSSEILRSFKLTVATRSNTRQRHDFLWIPDDETGNGSAYSYIQSKEN